MVDSNLYRSQDLVSGGGHPFRGGGPTPYFSPQTPNHKGPPLCTFGYPRISGGGGRPPPPAPLATPLSFWVCTLHHFCTRESNDNSLLIDLYGLYMQVRMLEDAQQWSRDLSASKLYKLCRLWLCSICGLGSRDFVTSSLLPPLSYDLSSTRSTQPPAPLSNYRECLPLGSLISP